MFSQPFPVPAIGAEWNNSEIQYGDAPFPRTYTTRMEIKGDTIIDSTLYAKAYSTWSVSYIQIGFCEFVSFVGPTYSEQYLGGIRSDNNNRVYFFGVEDSTERLLYDFSAETGDTIFLDGLEGRYFTIIQETDSILIGESFRKELYSTGYNRLGDRWIEGIGSTFGFFATLFRHWEYVDYELTCYEENDVTLYSSQAVCTKCDIVTENQPDQINKYYSVTPNPVTQFLCINFPNTIVPKKLLIVDLTGHIVYSQSIFSTENIMIDRENLKQGVLFLIFIDNNKNISRERIVVL